jgi:outer membrane protein TolC
MVSKEAVALAEAEIARQDKRVDWSVSLMYSHRGPAFSDMVTFGVSVPLQWDQKNRQDRELAAKLAKAEQVRAEREEIGRERMAQMQRWMTSWQSRLVRLADYDQTLITLASERTRAALAAYRGGKAPLSAVLEARRLEIDTRVERLRLEMETAVLWTELEFLMPETETQAGATPVTSPQEQTP